jgi:hypothetical protein
MGIQLQESSAAACWNAGRQEFLNLSSWDHFETKIHARFMAKGYKLIALRMFLLCSQGKSPFLEYAGALTEARNVAGPTVITNTIYKYQLLFHLHTAFLLRIMALPTSDITVDDLISLMSMQWESIITKVSAALQPVPPHCCSELAIGITSLPTTTYRCGMYTPHSRRPYLPR